MIKIPKAAKKSLVNGDIGPFPMTGVAPCGNYFFLYFPEGFFPHSGYFPALRLIFPVRSLLSTFAILGASAIGERHNCLQILRLGK
jgi:hypothetical protein